MVSGHSLGGGVAQILGLLLRDKFLRERDDKTKVKIDVYTYAGPPVFTENLDGKKFVNK